ncbi:MAG: hypothetical protein ABI813_02910 [Bacteroidota bacterium]
MAMGQGHAQEPIHTKQTGITIKPTTDFDQRFYYVPEGGRQNVWGYRAGILINDKYKLGIGGYYMNRLADKPLTALGSGLKANALALRRQLYLGTVYYEPYLLRKTLWESSLVFETGYGRTVTTSPDKTTNTMDAKRNALLVPVGIGLSVNIKLPAIFRVQCFRWVGINAMAGYRGILYQQEKQYKYNGFYWSLGGAIFLDRILEDWRKRKTGRP